MVDRIRGAGCVVQVHLGGTNIPYSACLMHSAEAMFVGDGFQPFPIERTLVRT